MQFSVLMSVYKNDNPSHFADAIKSILDQTKLPDQIVIVRDGPVGKSLQKMIDNLKSRIIDKIDIRVISLDENLGLSKALNEGLKACKYNYVARMDSDDISLPNRFEKQFDFLSNNKNISLLGGWYEQYDITMTNRVADRKVPEFNYRIKKYAMTRTPFNHVTGVFRKDHVLEVGGYPSIYGRLEDWWLALRLINNGYQLHNLQEYLVKVRGGEDFLFRRGGVEYIRWEMKNLIMMYNEGLIDVSSLIINFVVRGITRLVPVSIRKIVYKLIREF